MDIGFDIFFNFFCELDEKSFFFVQTKSIRSSMHNIMSEKKLNQSH